MRVLITGIEGFVGGHLTELVLQQKGVEVFGTSLNGKLSPSLERHRSSLDVRMLDITDTHAVHSVITSIRPDRIVHLAAMTFVPASMKNPVQTFQTNLLGGIHVLESVRDLQQAHGHSAHLLFVSTGEVYGNVDAADMPISEACLLQPQNPYASSKAAIDLIAQQYQRSFGLKITVARPFNHVGAGQAPIFVCSNFARQFAEIAAGRREPVLHVGNLESSRDFTDVHDVVRAYWELFDRRSDDTVFNVCSGKSHSISEVLALLMEISTLKVSLEQQTERMRTYDVTVVVGDCKRLQRATGWKPERSLRQSLTDLYAYWRDNLDS
jgi:GDP-4-dehydro-6-deoxy-D-mannose reductase